MKWKSSTLDDPNVTDNQYAYPNDSCASFLYYHNVKIATCYSDSHSRNMITR